MPCIVEGFNHIAKFWTLNDGMIYRRSVKVEGFAMFHCYSQTFCDQEVVLVTTSDWSPSPKSDTGLVEVSLEGAPGGDRSRCGAGWLGIDGKRMEDCKRDHWQRLVLDSFGQCSGTSWDSTLLVMILYWRVLPISVTQHSNLPLGNLFRVTCFLRAFWIMWLEFLFLTLDATMDMPAC